MMTLPETSTGRPQDGNHPKTSGPIHRVCDSPTMLFTTPKISHEMKEGVDVGELTRIPIQKPPKRSAGFYGKNNPSLEELF